MTLKEEMIAYTEIYAQQDGTWLMKYKGRYFFTKKVMGGFSFADLKLYEKVEKSLWFIKYTKNVDLEYCRPISYGGGFLKSRVESNARDMMHSYLSWERKFNESWGDQC